MNSETTYKWKVPANVKNGELLVNPVCRRLNTHCDGIACQQPDADGYLRLENDRIIPGASGGQYSLDNVGWLCADKNREKYTKPDASYMVSSFFDRPINLANLRPHQRDLGYGLAVGRYRTLFEKPNAVLSRWMLLAWMCGAGKTVGMLSILFGINAVRNATALTGGVRRVKKVLWLVHQQSLVDSLVQEIKTELEEHGICEANPSCYAVKSTSGWKYNGDITVACPQAIWDNDSNSLSEAEIAQILGNFDAIVVDEGHFAVEQYLQISKLAPLAFKFCVTATPIDDQDRPLSAEYPDSFALYSLFWYDAGRALGIYKEVLPFAKGLEIDKRVYFEQPAVGESVVRGSGGELKKVGSAEEITNNFPADKLFLEECLRIAESFDDVSNYRNQIMVRVSRIPRAKHLAVSLRGNLDVIGVWAGSPGPSLGSKDHPWMKWKQKPKNGKLQEATRCAITVNIGQFGINNKHCSVVAWIDGNFSLTELVQRLCRAIRASGYLKDRVKLVFRDSVNANGVRFSERLSKAIDYILREGEELIDSSFVKLDSFTEGSMLVEVPVAAANLKPEMRASLLEAVGRGMADGMRGEDLALHVRDNWMSAAPGASEKTVAAVDRFLHAACDEETQGEFLQKTLNLPAALEAFHPDLVLESTAKDAYSDDEVRCEIIAGRILSVTGATHAERVAFAESVLRDSMFLKHAQTQMRETRQKQLDLGTTEPVPPFLLLAASEADWDKSGFSHMGKSYAQELRDELKGAWLAGGGPPGGGQDGLFVKAKMALCTAAAQYFNIFDEDGKPSFSKDIYASYRKQLADALMREPANRHIKARAKAMLAAAHPGILAGHHKIISTLAPSAGGDL